jgi:3-dehydroquinate synthase
MHERALQIRSTRFTYDVELGDFADWRERASSAHRLFIADGRVLDLHPRVVEALRGEQVLRVEAIETNKTLAFAVEALLPFLLEHNATRASTVIAIGGGIVQDLVGFVCSIVFRGLPWSFYPTTLLAQADSCIGSKTSLNHQRFKNLLGTFFPPRRVVIDAKFLATLTDLDHGSGVGEIIKIHFLESEAASRELDSDIRELWGRSPEVVPRYVIRSLTYKQRFIETDEYDEGPRLVLNYGHCVGHALEAATTYAIPHGIAVMYGIAAANRLSARRGWLPAETCAAMNRVIVPRLPLRDIAARASFEDMLAALRRDKKNVGDKLVIIGTKGYGAMERMVDVSPADIRAVWGELMTEISAD